MGSAWIHPGEILLRLVAAAAFGGLIGWNRQRVEKPAGLRTHMLVSMGAAAFTLVMYDLLSQYPRPAGVAAGDPARIIQGVATGIGFLGAGSIIQTRGSVRGMTTAAGIWVVGAIGVACGTGSYYIGGITVGLTLLVLTAARRLERRTRPTPGGGPGAPPAEPPEIS